jgi:hypothetical protein
MRFTTLQHGDVHIALWLHTAEDPPADAFDAACVEIQEYKRSHPGVLGKMRMLVITDGGSPSSRQRAQLNAGALDRMGVKTAAITTQLNNPVKRRIAQAILWTQPLFKAYAPSQWRDALSYLGIDDPAVFEEAARVAAGLSKPLETLDAIRADIQAQATH